MTAADPRILVGVNDRRLSFLADAIQQRKMATVDHDGDGIPPPFHIEVIDENAGNEQ